MRAPEAPTQHDTPARVADAPARVADAPAEASRSPGWRSSRLPWAVLFAVVASLYLPAIDTFLDNEDAWNYVLEADLALEKGESTLVPGGGYLAHQNIHRLIPSLAWLPRYGLFGLWMPAWKLPSVLLHALNAVLVGLLAQRLLRRAGIERREGAFFAGALFGLAPIHAQPVSWLGGTYDLFLGAFALGAALAFERGKDRLAAVLVLGACLSKEPGVLVAPLLGVQWLCFSRAEGLKRGLIRLLPAILLTAAVLGLRRLQMVSASAPIDPMGIRAIALTPESLLIDAPLAAFSSLAAPLRELGVQSARTLGAAGLALFGLVLTGAALSTRGLTRRRVMTLGVFGGVMAVAFMVPMALMTELGKPIGLDQLVSNDRYLYVSNALLCLVAGAALLVTVSPLRRTLAVVVLGLTLSSAFGAVAGTVHPSSSGEVLLAAVSPIRGPARGGPTEQIVLLTNRYREETFRLAMSRWLEAHTGCQVKWVQRGAWRVIERAPDRGAGLDFVDHYVHVRDTPFDPQELTAHEPTAPKPTAPKPTARTARTAEVLLLTDATPGPDHSAIPAALPEPARRELAVAERLELLVKRDPAGLPFTMTPAPEGGVTFEIGHVTTSPWGWYHRAAAWLPAALDPQRVAGFRLTYTATGSAEPIGSGRAYALGYLELHWRSSSFNADQTYVVTPVQLDGQQHEVTLWMDIDPVWRASEPMTALGIAPLDRQGQVRVQRLEALVLPRAPTLVPSTPTPR